MILVRRLLGEVLRAERLRQGLSLRELSAAARVSRGYISEIERGRKEASSECLAAICTALAVPLSTVMRDVSGALEQVERTASVAALPTPARVDGQVTNVAA